MGMDLEPVNQDIEPYHFNFTGWQMLGNLLNDLDCDISEMDQFNDGKPIKKETCLDWAEQLQDALKRHEVLVKRIPDQEYEGGFREVFTVQGKGEGEAIDDKNRVWLEEIVAFLRVCDGCFQY